MKQAYPFLILLSLVVLLYSNTISHGFVLDDDVLISKNAFVQDGFSGIGDILSNDSFAGHERVGEGKSVLPGGRYRPLSLVLFAMVYEFAGWKAPPFHVLAILLYACVVLMLYKTLHYLLRDQPKGQLIALAASVLFTVHPVHTEVVANIKSCDESLALLFGLGAVYCLLRAFDDNGKKWMIFSGLSLLLACLSKESAIAFALLAPLALWFFRTRTINKIMRYSWPVFLAAIAYVILRTVIIGQSTTMEMMADPLNDPFLKRDGEAWVPFTFAERIATISFVCWKYLKLLVFPYPLTHDYYPFVIDVHSFAHTLDWVGFISMLGLTVWGIWCLLRRDAVGYGILFFLITISVTLNLFFLVGTFMAERFLFTPSVGFCLLVAMLGMLWQKQFSRQGNWLLIPGLAIVAIFALLTIRRNRDWKDNITLHTSAATTSAASAKLQNDLGTIQLNKALSMVDSLERKILIDSAFLHLQQAVTKHPTYYDALLAFGAASYYKGEYQSSVWAYQRAYALFPEDSKSEAGLFYALQGFAQDAANKGSYDNAIEALKMANEMMPDTVLAQRIKEYELKLIK